MLLPNEKVWVDRFIKNLSSLQSKCMHVCCLFTVWRRYLIYFNRMINATKWKIYWFLVCANVLRNELRSLAEPTLATLKIFVFFSQCIIVCGGHNLSIFLGTSKMSVHQMTIMATRNKSFI